MTSAEWRATASLASIYGLRRLVMFVVLPVFALFAQTLPGGARRIDRWGRKPVIYSGLAILALGSSIAAHASDTSVFALCFLLIVLWLAATATMAPPAGNATTYSMGET